MGNIENALGKKIQITNSPIYCSLIDKFDPQTSLDYESLMLSIGNLSNTLSKGTGADSDKVKLLTSIYGLSKLDGGKVTYDYINSKISERNAKISELDVMLHNLASIFPDCEKRFTQDDFVEFASMLSDNPTTLETKIIKICYYLKLLSQNYKKEGRLDDKTSVEFIFKNIRQIVNEYKQTGNLLLNDNLIRDYQKYSTIDANLGIEEMNKLDLHIQNYNNGIDSKFDFINNLNSYRLEKKTKIK